MYSEAEGLLQTCTSGPKSIPSTSGFRSGACNPIQKLGLDLDPRLQWNGILSLRDTQEHRTIRIGRSLVLPGPLSSQPVWGDAEEAVKYAQQ